MGKGGIVHSCTRQCGDIQVGWLDVEAWQSGSVLEGVVVSELELGVAGCQETVLRLWCVSLS